jgi:hypothetical protein
MSLSKISFAIASVVVLAASAPAFAGNDSGTVQEVIQTTTAGGSGSTAISTANQNSTTRQTGRDNASGTSQRADQQTTANGRRSYAASDANQDSNTVQRRR